MLKAVIPLSCSYLSWRNRVYNFIFYTIYGILLKIKLYIVLVLEVFQKRDNFHKRVPFNSVQVMIWLNYVISFFSLILLLNSWITFIIKFKIMLWINACCAKSWLWFHILATPVMLLEVKNTGIKCIFLCYIVKWLGNTNVVWIHNSRWC